MEDSDYWGSTQCVLDATFPSHWEAHCGVLWMDQFACCVDTCTVCFGQTVVLCGEEHDVLWKRSLWRITLSQGMKFCRQGKENLVCYGVVLL